VTGRVCRRSSVPPASRRASRCRHPGCLDAGPEPQYASRKVGGAPATPPRHPTRHAGLRSRAALRKLQLPNSSGRLGAFAFRGQWVVATVGNELVAWEGGAHAHPEPKWRRPTSGGPAVSLATDGNVVAVAHTTCDVSLYSFTDGRERLTVELRTPSAPSAMLMNPQRKPKIIRRSAAGYSPKAEARKLSRSRSIQHVPRVMRHFPSKWAVRSIRRRHEPASILVPTRGDAGGAVLERPSSSSRGTRTTPSRGPFPSFPLGSSSPDVERASRDLGRASPDVNRSSRDVETFFPRHFPLVRGPRPSLPRPEKSVGRPRKDLPRGPMKLARQGTYVPGPRRPFPRPPPSFPRGRTSFRRPESRPRGRPTAEKGRGKSLPGPIPSFPCPIPSFRVTGLAAGRRGSRSPRPPSRGKGTGTRKTCPRADRGRRPSLGAWPAWLSRGSGRDCLATAFKAASIAVPSQGGWSRPSKRRSRPLSRRRARHFAKTIAHGAREDQ